MALNRSCVLFLEEKSKAKKCHHTSLNDSLQGSSSMFLTANLRFASEFPENGPKHQSNECGEKKSDSSVKRIAPIRQALFP